LPDELDPPLPDSGAALRTSDRAADLRPPAIPKSPDKIDRAQAQHETPQSPRSLPRLSEKTLLSVLETDPDALVVIDARGTIVLVNEQTERMFGYRRVELLGEKVEILVPIRHRGQHVQQRRGFFQAPHIRAMGEAGMPLFGLRKDGREFPVEISLSPLETEDGILVTSAIRDVTERKMRDAQLAKSEARYRSLVEEIPAVTFMAALDEGINELYVSPQIVDLLGFTQQAMARRPGPLAIGNCTRKIASVGTPNSRAPAPRPSRFAPCIASWPSMAGSFGCAAKLRSSATRTGRPMFLQGVAFDITERKSAEEELKLLNQSLGQRVADRTAELDRSNRDLERYGDFVCHELKKPVGALFDALEGSIDQFQAKEARQRPRAHRANRERHGEVD